MVCRPLGRPQVRAEMFEHFCPKVGFLFDNIISKIWGGGLNGMECPSLGAG